MAAMLHSDNILFRLKFHWNLFHSPIENNPTLVQIFAWQWTGDKQLFEPMMTKFADALRRHAASMGQFHHHRNILSVFFSVSVLHFRTKTVFPVLIRTCLFDLDSLDYSFHSYLNSLFVISLSYGHVCDLNNKLIFNKYVFYVHELMTYGWMTSAKKTFLHQ